MSETVLECQGLPCPEPVLKCKRCIENESPDHLRVVVDNQPARENVTRFLERQGYEVTSEAGGGNFTVSGTRKGVDPAECDVCEVMSERQLDAAAVRTAAFITTEFLGSGDDVLGGKLMYNFLGTLPELGERLWRIVLVNGGVKLSTEGHPCLDKLRSLADAGVSILVCGTCLEHFGLLDAKIVGETTNMLDVVTSLDLADKVIKI